MANIKNFGITGIGTDVQFGKNGARLVQSNGTLFEFRTANSASLIRIAAAAPSASDDVSTKGFVDQQDSLIANAAGLTASLGYEANTSANYLASASSLFNADNLLDAAIYAVQGELDATQTGAGLAANGAYVGNAGGNFIGNATSLMDAINKLDTALQGGSGNLQTELDDTQTGAGLAANGAYIVPGESNYLTMTTSLASADLALDSAIDALQTEVDATQTGAGLASNGAYIANTSGNYIAGATSLAGADNALDAALYGIEGRVFTTEGDITNLETELDDTQTGAGLAANGAYVANSSANYTSGATSLFVADNLLDTAVKAVQTELDDTQTGAGLAANGAYVANSSANYTSGATSLFNADDKLDAAVKAVQDELDATQTGAGLAANGAYVGNAGGNYIGNATSLMDAINALDAALQGGSGNLQTELDDTQTGAGLAANGAYVANTSANYTSGATSLFVADNLLDAAIKAVQTELDDTQTGSGLAANGAYVANTSANYISGASSLTNADDLLDAAIDALQTELDDTQTGVGLASNGAFIPMTTTNYLTNATSIANAVELIDGEVKGVYDMVTALGNAFNYVGTLAGGANEGGATDMALEAETDAGDYYKVSTSGWFKVGAGAAFYANAGDGLVFNTSGGVDKIDNTDSTVAGTAGRISVSGSADTGYTVDIDSTYVGQNSITTVGTISTGAWQGNVVTETYGGTGFSTFTQGQILVGASDNGLDTLNKGTAKQYLRVDGNAVTLEYASLVAGDVAYTSNAIGFSANTVEAALNDLNARGGGSQDELDATQLGAGLAANGAYVANSSANYTSGATSLFNADNLLDAAIKSVADSVTNLVQDEIIADNTLYTVKAANASIIINGDVDGSKTQIGTIVAGASTNTEFQIDVATADEVRFEASGSSADVDLRLVPQGNGAVIVGDSGAGLIQAEAGFDLTVAGGDDSSTGGDLILRGGNGTTKGVVDVQDGAGNTVAIFDGVSAPTGHAKFISGVAEATFAADGSASDIDIVLAPKGAGVIDASSAPIVNVANATADTDAVNYGQLVSSQIGLVKTLVTEVTEATGNVSLGTIKGTVLRVKVLISTAFGSQITVGTSTSTAQLASTSDIDEATTGLYLIENMQTYSVNTSLVAAVAGTGAGVAKVIVEYLQG